jgi:uncharacterized protein YecT (DUF1311 family)
MASRRTWAFALTLAVLIAAPVHAQTQLELTMKAKEAAEAADKKLNATYKRLLPLLDAEAKAKLIAAETAWITFRDRQCLFEGDWYRGGSASPYQYNLCLQRMTEARTKELETAIKHHRN